MRLYPQMLLPAFSQSEPSPDWPTPQPINGHFLTTSAVPQITSPVLEFHLTKVHMMHFVIVFFKSLGMLKSLSSAHLVF